MIGTLFLIALALVLAPYIVIYKYLEKKDWKTAAIGGVIFACIKGAITFAAAYIILTQDFNLITSILIGIACYALTVFIINRYLKKYSIKRPIVFYLWLVVASIALAVIMMIFGLALIGYMDTMQAMIPLGGI